MAHKEAPKKEQETKPIVWTDKPPEPWHIFNGPPRTVAPLTAAEIDSIKTIVGKVSMVTLKGDMDYFAQLKTEMEQPTPSFLNPRGEKADTATYVGRVSAAAPTQTNCSGRWGCSCP